MTSVLGIFSLQTSNTVENHSFTEIILIIFRANWNIWAFLSKRWQRQIIPFKQFSWKKNLREFGWLIKYLQSESSINLEKRFPRWLNLRTFYWLTSQELSYLSHGFWDDLKCNYKVKYREHVEVQQFKYLWKRKAQLFVSFYCSSLQIFQQHNYFLYLMGLRNLNNVYGNPEFGNMCCFILKMADAFATFQLLLRRLKIRKMSCSWPCNLVLNAQYWSLPFTFQIQCFPFFNGNPKTRISCCTNISRPFQDRPSWVDCRGAMVTM